ncbi:uncharacterized protein LOC100563670 [Anolis carolinensis]|uniref:uncharacterized protein LOC100563670 n=1 Tax=Anolis carolinensis TaxID=28377 RepID=UPI002F2B5D22
MSACCTVCVRGYPTSLPPERIVDKLMIHFLRTRNGGGEIVNTEFTPEFPDCAVITFEDATVAQRVLKTKEHILSVDGKKYPLEVTPYPVELNPNEIFVCVSMKIDYGSFPNGKEILCRLQKQYEDVRIKFDSQEMTCSVKGPYTVLQAFNSELLRCLKNKQSRSLSASQKRSSAKPSGNGASHQEETQREKKQNDGKLLLAQNFGESHVEPVEDFSLVIDSDVYHYIQAFCSQEINHVLSQHKVDVVDVSSDGVTTLYIQASSSETGGMSTLVPAHQAISRLSQKLEGTLRKEKINKKELGMEWGTEFLRELRKLCPQLLCHEDHEYFYLVGNLVDVSQAKLFVQDFTAARKVVQDHQKPGLPQTSHLPLINGQNVMPTQLELPTESVPRKVSSPTFSDKAKHKLAAKFSSSASLSSVSSQDNPLAEQLPRDFLQTFDYQIPSSELQFLPATDNKSEDQMRPFLQSEKAPQAMKEDLLHLMSGSTLSSTEGITRFDLKGPSSPHVGSNTFRSLNLFDTTRYGDHKVSKQRPFLRRSSSLQNPPDSSTLMDESQIAAAVNMDDLKQESQEHNQREKSKEGAFQMENERERDSQNIYTGVSASLTVQRGDGELLDTKKTDSLARYFDHIRDNFSYSELAVEGPEDEALIGLCNYLKGCHEHVLVNRERYMLSLAYPREVKLQIQEAFRSFSEKRMASLSKRLDSSEAQQEKSQEEIQKSLQQLKEDNRANLSEGLLDSGGPPGEKLSSQTERLLGVRGAHPLMHDFPSDRSLDKNPDTCKQGLLKKSVAELRPGLPDKFHFGQSCSRERGSRITERGPQSLPILPQGTFDSTPSQTAGKHTLPTEEDVTLDMNLRAAPPGRESTAGVCDLCQSSPHTPCRHILSKAYASTESISPPHGHVTPCRVTPTIPGTFTAATLSQFLPGYYRDPTLKVIYDIPNGVQQAGHPRPGCPYRGGRFEAFLPDNPEGRRLMLLLRKAFKHNLIFQIQTCGTEEKVVWGSLPHKTSMEGGKVRNGYPDSQYLQFLRLKLKELGIE